MDHEKYDQCFYDVTSVTWLDYTNIGLQILMIAAIIGGAVLAYRGVKKSLDASRDDMRDRATMDLLMRRMGDRRYFECHNYIRNLDGAGNCDVKRFAENDQRNCKESKRFIYVLNQCEYLAVGIRNGTYSATILEEATKTTTIELWEFLQPFILRMRKCRGSPTAYEHFEDLVKQWTTQN
tara:strand:- start:1721 stop:2260 length:540 start_codon:yes stop_codon:yes gene_type:complete